MDEDLGHRHPDPAARVRKATGMPGPAGTQVAQQPGEHVRGGDGVVDLLRGRCCSPVTQHRESMLGAPGDLSRVEQQRISDVLDASRRCPPGRRSDRRPSGVVVINRGQWSQGGRGRGDISGWWFRHAALSRMAARPAAAVTASPSACGKQPDLRQEAHLVSLWRAGTHTTLELAELFKVARSTVYRAIQCAGVQA